jgi:hypothetical protein
MAIGLDIRFPRVALASTIQRFSLSATVVLDDRYYWPRWPLHQKGDGHDGNVSIYPNPDIQTETPTITLPYPESAPQQPSVSCTALA